MSDPTFFAKPRPVTLAEVAAWAGGRLADEGKSLVTISGVAPLDTAGDSAAAP